MKSQAENTEKTAGIDDIGIDDSLSDDVDPGSKKLKSTSSQVVDAHAQIEHENVTIADSGAAIGETVKESPDAINVSKIKEFVNKNIVEWHGMVEDVQEWFRIDPRWWSGAKVQ